MLADNPLPIVRSNNIYENTSTNFYASIFASPGSVTLDATDNWWGTTDVSVIRSKIYTGASSSPSVNSGTPRSASTGLLAIVLSNVASTVKGVDPLATGVPARGVYNVSRAGTVKVEIRRQSDKVVVYVYSQAPSAAGQYGFAWNGRMANGTIVSPGMYRAVLTANDGRDDMKIDVPPSASTAAVTESGMNVENQRVYQNEFYKANISVSVASLLSLRITPQGGNAFYAFQDVLYPAGVSTVYWDGRDPQGNLVTVKADILVADATELVPTAIQVIGVNPKITGALAAPNIEVKADPYLVTHSYEQISRMAYRLNKDAYVRFVLLPPGDTDIRGSSAIVLLDNDLELAKDAGGALIDHVVEWRGYNSATPSKILAGVDGAYTFAIEAREPSTNQSTVYRGVLNLRQ